MIDPKEETENKVPHRLNQSGHVHDLVVLAALRPNLRGGDKPGHYHNQWPMGLAGGGPVSYKPAQPASNYHQAFRVGYGTVHAIHACCAALCCAALVLGGRKTTASALDQCR